jgi:hypothetical protein
MAEIDLNFAASYFPFSFFGKNALVGHEITSLKMSQNLKRDHGITN